jgi:O-antigen/teichoic acid export membrane protein
VSDAPRQAYGRIAARGGLIGLVGFGGSQLVNLLTYVALARILVPAQFGVFAAGSLISGIGGLFAESGMLAALLTRRERFEEAANTAFVWNVVSGGGLALISLGVSPLIGVVFRDRGVAGVSAALSGILWLRALSIVPDTMLQRRLSFLRRMVIDPLSMVAFGVVAVSTTSSGAGVWGLVLASYASVGTRVVGAWSFARWRPHPRAASLALWRELIAFSRSVLLSEIIRNALAYLDVLLIGRYIGAASLGQ